MGVSYKGQYVSEAERVLIIGLGLWFGWTLGAEGGEWILHTKTGWMGEGAAGWIGTLVCWVIGFELGERVSVLTDCWVRLLYRLEEYGWYRKIMERYYRYRWGPIEIKPKARKKRRRVIIVDFEE